MKHLFLIAMLFVGCGVKAQTDSLMYYRRELFLRYDSLNYTKQRMDYCDMVYPRCNCNCCDSILFYMEMWNRQIDSIGKIMFYKGKNIVSEWQPPLKKSETDKIRFLNH